MFCFHFRQPMKIFLAGINLHMEWVSKNLHARCIRPELPYFRNKVIPTRLALEPAMAISLAVGTLRPLSSPSETPY